jgi:hypothetical protein
MRENAQRDAVPGHCMTSDSASGAVRFFREAELRYLAGGRQLGRIATVGVDGTPHVVPVAWIYNAARDTIDIGAESSSRRRSFAT